jgi:predicted ribonuclease YlaK
MTNKPDAEVENLISRIAEKEVLLVSKDIDTETWPFLAKLTFEEYQQFRSVATQAHTAGYQKAIEECLAELPEELPVNNSGFKENYAWNDAVAQMRERLLGKIK